MKCFDAIKLPSAASATDGASQKKFHETGIATLIISNKEMENIMKIVNLLQNRVCCQKMLAKQLKIKQNTAKRHVTGMLLGTLAALLLGNMFVSKVKIPG